MDTLQQFANRVAYGYRKNSGRGNAAKATVKEHPSGLWARKFMLLFKETLESTEPEQWWTFFNEDHTAGNKMKMGFFNLIRKAWKDDEGVRNGRDQLHGQKRMFGNFTKYILLPMKCPDVRQGFMGFAVCVYAVNNKLNLETLTEEDVGPLKYHDKNKGTSYDFWVAFKDVQKPGPFSIVIKDGEFCTLREDYHLGEGEDPIENPEQEDDGIEAPTPEPVAIENFEQKLDERKMSIQAIITSKKAEIEKHNLDLFKIEEEKGRIQHRKSQLKVCDIIINVLGDALLEKPERVIIEAAEKLKLFLEPGDEVPGSSGTRTVSESTGNQSEYATVPTPPSDADTPPIIPGNEIPYVADEQIIDDAGNTQGSVSDVPDSLADEGVDSTLNTVAREENTEDANDAWIDQMDLNRLKQKQAEEQQNAGEFIDENEANNMENLILVPPVGDQSGKEHALLSLKRTYHASSSGELKLTLKKAAADDKTDEKGKQKKRKTSSVSARYASQAKGAEEPVEQNA